MRHARCPKLSRQPQHLEQSTQISSSDTHTEGQLLMAFFPLSGPPHGPPPRCPNIVHLQLIRTTLIANPGHLQPSFWQVERIGTCRTYHLGSMEFFPSKRCFRQVSRFGTTSAQWRVSGKCLRTGTEVGLLAVPGVWLTCLPCLLFRLCCVAPTLALVCRQERPHMGRLPPGFHSENQQHDHPGPHLRRNGRRADWTCVTHHGCSLHFDCTFGRCKHGTRLHPLLSKPKSTRNQRLNESTEHRTGKLSWTCLIFVHVRLSQTTSRTGRKEKSAIMETHTHQKKHWKYNVAAIELSVAVRMWCGDVENDHDLWCCGSELSLVPGKSVTPFPKNKM